MSSTELVDFFVHQVQVATYRSTTGRGVKQYDGPVTVACFLSRKQRLVRAANGDQVVSGATVSADIAAADALTVGSLVTIDGHDRTVIAVDISTGGPLIEGLDRVKAYLQ